MPAYTLHYWSADVGTDARGLHTWSVYSEQYLTPQHDEPIDGSQRLLSTWPTEAQADAEARRLQQEVSN